MFHALPKLVLVLLNLVLQCIFFLTRKHMAASGVINAGMLGLQGARFDKLEVLWIDEEGSDYVDAGLRCNI